MGWSCRKDAGEVMDAWIEACVAQTGSQNTFHSRDGRSDEHRYFWEASRTEHPDGAITGSIWRFVGEDKCRKTGTFRIEGDGTVTRAPKFLKDIKVEHRQMATFEVFAPRQYAPTA